MARKQIKKSPPKQTRSSSNVFSMRPLSRDCYLKSAVTINFENVIAPQAKTKQIQKEGPSQNVHQYKSYSIIPSLVKDGLCYTPLFANEYEPPEVKQNFKEYQKLIAESTMQIPCARIMRPKPKLKEGKLQFCYVCTEKYEDYDEHIDSEVHKFKRILNQFEEDIAKIMKKVRKNYRKERGEKCGRGERVEKKKAVIKDIWYPNRSKFDHGSEESCPTIDSANSRVQQLSKKIQIIAQNIKNIKSIVVRPQSFF